MDFLTLSEQRYSCRSMSDKKVAPELLEKIIKAAVLAPTAVDTQPFKIWNMASESAKEAVRSCTRFSFGADTFLVVGYNEEEAWTRKYDGRNFADVDASIVATHMMLEIEDLGLATTWVGHFNAPKLKELCPQMQGYELIAIFPIGYAADNEEAKPAPKHFIRKDKEEILETL